MPEFPKKISDNGWYELSDGTTVRGEDAAREAEQRLADEDLALATDPEFVADREEAEREYADGETTTLDEFNQELAEEESEEGLGPLSDPRDFDPRNLEGKKCANCDRDAVTADVPSTANPVYYCDQHRPVYLR